MQDAPFPAADAEAVVVEIDFVDGGKLFGHADGI
jgi:hypothetical protein